MSSIQAPRGTFDVLPADAERRAVLEAHAERILGGAGYGRIETPTFEATELFARGVGGATDIVQKEMYSLRRRRRPLADAAARGDRAGLPRLHRARDAQAAAAGQALVPVHFFRAEAPQKGRYRQFWQIGAEAIGADGPETDAELILLLADLLRGARRRAASGCASPASARPRPAPSTARS